MGQLARRFERDTITIGVAGKARQGKSTLLQAISGLTNEAIPAAKGLPCTGAKSRIIHYKTDAPYAEVEFYNSAEFFAQISSYYQELFSERQPADLAAFIRDFPGKDESFKEHPEKQKRYSILKEIHGDMPSVKGLLGLPQKRIGIAEVGKYVSQHQKKWFRAVKCVHIYVAFPNNDVEGLSLIDLPGLGEMTKGYTEKLMSSLQEDIDAVLLIRRPDPDDQGDDWLAPDYRLFEDVKVAVPALDLHDWLFIVLNKTADGDNHDTAELLRKRPLDMGSNPELLMANFLDAEEVRNVLLPTVLRHLEDRLARNDKKQVDEALGGVRRLSQKTRDIIRGVEQVLSHRDESNRESENFDRIFEAFWEDFCVNCEDLRQRYAEQIDDQEMLQKFETAVEQACDESLNRLALPSDGELVRLAKKFGGWDTVSERQQHNLRVFLTRTVSDQLNDYFRELVEAFYRDLSEQLLPLFLDPKDRTRKGVTQLREFFHSDVSENLYQAFDYLADFELSYKSHFHHRVREQMACLDPADKDSSLKLPRLSNFYKAEDADQLRRGLESHYHEAAHAVRKKLTEEMQKDPSRILFALAEEFCDRASRAKDIEKEWKKFTRTYRHEIWPEHFGAFYQMEQLREQFQKRSREVQNHLDSLQQR